MEHTESSYPCTKRTNSISPSSPYYHHNRLHQYQASTESGECYGNSCGVLFGKQTSTNFEVASAISLEPSRGSETGGEMEACGKVLFTATQWQELERQTMIYKYIMASIPVPPQLLIPLSTQSNRAGMDLRFSSGSDPEPWRCRRTDGKKWRCSRDVAPDQKYCERHAHKSRPRSRKPVEIQSHNTNTTTSALNVTAAYTNTPGNTDILSAAAAASYQHPRCTEWFMKSGTIPVSSSNQPFQQSMHSSRVGWKRDHNFPQDFEANHQHESHLNYSNPHLTNTTCTTASDAAAGARRQHFIDAWSRSGEGDNCSLTLSMQYSGNGDNQSFQMGVEMLDVERGLSEDVLKSHNQWSNQASWMGSPPGGPLGEALCLGIARAVKGPMNVPSPHGQ